VLKDLGITINAYVSTIGLYSLSSNYFDILQDEIEKSPVRCPDKIVSKQMFEYLEKLKTEGDTTGGIISCVIKNLSFGLGEPVFDKLNADLAKAMLSINAAKGFEYGKGFEAATMRGSQHNDTIEPDFTTKTNNAGGIVGGISNGEDIYFRVAFKPVATLMQSQKSVNKRGDIVIIKPAGRHDICVVPRAVPIVESMAALVIVDHYLRAKAIS